MLKKRIQVDGAKVLIMGLTFKENCPDLRNTKIIDVVHELSTYNIEVDVYDPWVNATEAQHEYGITPISNLEDNKYDAVILAVSHSQFKEMGIETIRKLAKSQNVIYDLKYLFKKEDTDLRL